MSSLWRSSSGIRNNNNRKIELKCVEFCFLFVLVFICFIYLCVFLYILFIVLVHLFFYILFIVLVHLFFYIFMSFLDIFVPILVFLFELSNPLCCQQIMFWHFLIRFIYLILCWFLKCVPHYIILSFYSISSSLLLFHFLKKICCFGGRI